MIAIIDYDAGNIRSVKNAVERMGYQAIITQKYNEISQADKVIFPGVGEANSAMQSLKKTNLDQVILGLKQPVLGICLGQQLMCNHSQEGDTIALGIFDAEVKRFPPKDLIPHMGWNNLSALKSPLLNGITNNDEVYFVHSYYCEVCPETIAVCDYILPFSGAMQKDNFYATQFHPEKSASVGERILQNFLTL